MITNLDQYPVVRDIDHTPDSLIKFEDSIIALWEGARVRGPIHLSNGNEHSLIEIFKRVNTTDWVFST